MSKIGIIKCSDYEYDEVIKKVYEALIGLSSIKEMEPGRVLVKTNLLNQLDAPMFLDERLVERDVLFGISNLVERKLRKGELSIVGIRDLKK